LVRIPKEVSYNQGHPNLASIYTEVSLRYFCEDALLSDGISAMTVKAEQVMPFISGFHFRNFVKETVKLVSAPSIS